jgi:hypothetical protein
MASLWELSAPTRIGTTFTVCLSNQHRKREKSRMCRDKSLVPKRLLNGYDILTKDLPLKYFSKVGQMHFHAMFSFIHTKIHKFKFSSGAEFLDD